jgi:radical SAM-linked protein
MYTEIVQRLRITYSVEGALCYASVLDMGRLWERLLRRARVPLAYSQGFNPHPHLQFAAALPVGYSSACEMLDIFLGAEMPPLDLARAVTPQAPQGLRVLQVEVVPLKAEAPQAHMRLAHYTVHLYTTRPRADVQAALDALLARPAIPRQRIKKGRLAEYDLRPLIGDVRYVSTGLRDHELCMELQTGPNGAGRPEEIIAELGLDVADYTIHRTRLIWDTP